MTTATVEAPATTEAPVTTEIALLDMGSIAFPIYAKSGSEPDPDYTSTQIVARVRSLTASHSKAAICCDSGKSFRHEIDPEYKANRPERDAALFHQIDLAKERLAAEGYPVWSVKGYEADDLIASAAAVLSAAEGVRVLIHSSDKDLLQLVGEKVRAKSVTNGNDYDVDAVRAKFGVSPSQIVDYLTLVGDASDNVKGAKGIGEKKAAALLKQFGSLDQIYAMLPTLELQQGIRNSLIEFEPRWKQVRQLITLRADAPIDLSDLENDRRANVPNMEETDMEAAIVGDTVPVSTGAAPQPTPHVEPQTAPTPAPPVPAGSPLPWIVGDSQPKAEQALAVVDVLAPAPAEWGKQLEPRSMGEAAKLANYMHQARMFSGYGSPQAVLSTILAGRELGMNAIASLRAFHVIEGKHALAADAMRALVMRSGIAEYFRVIERTAERATFETKRKGDPEPVRLTYTIKDGRTAFGFGTDTNQQAAAERELKWQRSSWGKHTPDMLAARSSSKLARLVYGDVLFGLYAPEELRD